MNIKEAEKQCQVFEEELCKLKNEFLRINYGDKDNPPGKDVGDILALIDKTTHELILWRIAINRAEAEMLESSLKLKYLEEFNNWLFRAVLSGESYYSNVDPAMTLYEMLEEYKQNKMDIKNLLNEINDFREKTEVCIIPKNNY